MRKPWVYKRKNVKGWWTGWYEGSRRKAKAFPTKVLAEHFRYIKYTQLNSHVFTSVVDFGWHPMVEEYRRCERVEGLVEASLYEIQLTLRNFKRIIGLSSSKGTTQQAVDGFVLKRSEEVVANTLNKDIRNIHTLLDWAIKNRFVASGLEIRKVKMPQKPVVSLSPKEAKDLLAATGRYPAVRVRVLLAVTAGLRRGDIEAMCIGDIHFGRNTITTRNRRAGKAMPERPVPEQVMTELSNYVAALTDGQERLFTDRFTSKKWNRVRERVGMPKLKFHDLRKTLASLLAQRGVSTAVTQRLLEHSSPHLTNEVYTNVDPALRQAVNCLPVTGWL